MSFQAQKNLVLQLQAGLIASPGEADQILQGTTTEDYVWRGYYPFDSVQSRGAAVEFWAAFSRSFSALQRRADVFFAGASTVGGGDDVWVVSMGHIMGLFDAPFLGAAPTHKLAALRYSEFNRVVNGKVVETAFYCDFPHLLAQAGVVLFPQQTARHLVQPGPQTHDGLLYADAPAGEGAATLAVIEQMTADIGRWDSGLPLVDELRRTWREDMTWWGPEGIGATYTIDRYAEQHAGPFRAAFSERTKTNHVARLAEGHFGGFFGWPNFRARLTGPFMGRPATQDVGEFRVIDIYRREGDKLAENWIFIDLLHFWRQQGFDALREATGFVVEAERSPNPAPVSA